MCQAWFQELGADKSNKQNRQKALLSWSLFVLERQMDKEQNKYFVFCIGKWQVCRRALKLGPEPGGAELCPAFNKGAGRGPLSKDVEQGGSQPAGHWRYMQQRRA